MSTTLDNLRLQHLLSSTTAAQTRRILKRLQRRHSKLQVKDWGNEVQKGEDLTFSSYYRVQEANLRQQEASRTARAMNLYRAFFTGRPYVEVEEKNTTKTLDPVKVVVDYLPEKLTYETLIDLTEWVVTKVEPTETRVKKMEKAAAKQEVHFAKRKENSKKAQEAHAAQV